MARVEKKSYNKVSQIEKEMRGMAVAMRRLAGWLQRPAPSNLCGPERMQPDPDVRLKRRQAAEAYREAAEVLDNWLFKAFGWDPPPKTRRIRPYARRTPAP